MYQKKNTKISFPTINDQKNRIAGTRLHARLGIAINHSAFGCG